MAHTVWFKQELPCSSCGALVPGGETDLHTSGLSRESINFTVTPGEIVELAVDDFSDGFLTLKDPGDGPIRAIENWGCPACKATQWARLDFSRLDASHYRFDGATTVPLAPEILLEMNYVSSWLDRWVETSPGPETDELMKVVGHLMPWLPARK